MGHSGERDAFYAGALAMRYHLPYDTERNGEHEMDGYFFSGAMCVRMPIVHAVSWIGEPGYKTLRILTNNRNIYMLI